jgi:hypothetical protein
LVQSWQTVPSFAQLPDPVVASSLHTPALRPAAMVQLPLQQSAPRKQMSPV